MSVVEKIRADPDVLWPNVALMDPRSQVGKIIRADINQADKEMILGGKARRFLGL